MKPNIGKILIVDDESSNRKILVTLLSDYVTILAKDGAQAIQRVESVNDIDLILLDVRMPKVDGYEVCRQLKSNENTKDIPIIFITAMGKDDDETLGFQLGGADYITKPFNSEVVKARVNHQIKLRQQYKALLHLNSIDPLSGVANRRHLDTILKSEWRRAQSTNLPLSILMVDIDYFKLFNDAYGHQEGDRCITRVADCLKEHIRDAVDCIARYGGEEFCIVLPDTDQAHSNVVAERLVNAIYELQINHIRSPVSDYLTVSIGVATMTESTQDTDQLIRDADKGLYACKGKGRATYAHSGNTEHAMLYPE